MNRDGTVKLPAGKFKQNVSPTQLSAGESILISDGINLSIFDMVC